ncbi:MAG: hypothetical protein M3457_00025 [Chloroflexota bacterium]|nr:hypothetical protein [Chloroflexota bacterium]
MDYIIFGTGSSATLVLTGWLLRDWGPRLRDRRPAEDEILSASTLVTRMAWARFCASCGMALLICGVLVMLVTLGAALLASSDRAATIAVISMFGLAALLMLIWTGLYLRQFGAFGIIRPREKQVKPEPSATPEPAMTASTSPPDPAAEAIDQPAPSFAETTASRGGLGRFMAFFRRDPTEGREPAPTPPNAAPDDAAPTIADNAPNVEISPTEAVIAELSGESDTAEAKKLSPSDPLVTSVRDIPPESSIEDAVVSEVLGPDHHETAALVPETPSADTGTEAADDAPTTDLPDREQALAQLRRRRLSRLSNPNDPE